MSHSSAPTNPHIELDRHLSRLRDITDLAGELGVSRNYIIAMKHHGFRMPGGKASLQMARDFISTCQEFKVREHRQEKPPHGAASSGK